MNILQARLKLSFARMLKADLDRGADFISNFNCVRADTSIIVGGCSEKVWQMNYEQAITDVRDYLTASGMMDDSILDELEKLAQSGAK